MKTNFTKISPVERTDYRELISFVSEAVWPEFMLNSPVSYQYWDGLFENFPDYQFALLSQEDQRVAGIANSVPLSWRGSLEELPDEGWDWAMIKSAEDYVQGIQPNLLCGIQISIVPDFQGQGLSKIMLNRMVALARSKGYPRVIIPVRPSLKHRYPLTPIDAYIRWTTAEGLPFDPWLRVHVRVGGRIAKPCPTAMEIPGTISDWENWTGMKFFESGEYIVPGALTPLQIDVDEDRGTYIEPNVWVVHEVNET
jgi:GNAT superfamily N-acetyltransferase